MKDKRGTKRSRSPSKEGSSSPSGGSTPSPMLSRSPPPPGSPLEISSHHPCSSVFEQGDPSEKVAMVDLFSSSDEEGLILDTSRDEEFTKRFFDDLNPDVLGPSGDSKIIILSDSDEEEEVCEEDAASTEDVPSAAARSLASTASTDDVDNANKGDSPDRR
jgi:hypothetical protein